MIYKEIQPDPKLSRYIECYWYSTGKGDTSAGERFSVLADGCMDIIFNLGSPAYRITKCGKAEATYTGAEIIGQILEPVIVRLGKVSEAFGIRFRPFGAYPFLLIPVFEFTGQYIPVGQLSNPFLSELQSRVFDAYSLPSIIKTIDQTFIAQLKNIQPPDAAVESAVTAIKRNHGNISLKAVSEASTMSMRHLQRKFQKLVGISPKFLCRVARFQNAVKNPNNYGLAQTALECGYFDQAHFAKDFKAFSGKNPLKHFSNAKKHSKNLA